MNGLDPAVHRWHIKAERVDVWFNFDIREAKVESDQRSVQKIGFSNALLKVDCVQRYISYFEVRKQFNV